jgi:hypothetical protein
MDAGGRRSQRLRTKYPSYGRGQLDSTVLQDEMRLAPFLSRRELGAFHI